MPAQPNPKIETAYAIIVPGKPPVLMATMMTQRPSLDELRSVIRPALRLTDDDHFERVAVLNQGVPTDMFVDECGAVKGLPRNDEATKIYHAFWLTKYPDADVSKLPFIAGIAVLFNRRVWF